MAELPEKYTCRVCETEKPVGEMMVVRYRKERKVVLRPRCKLCHNQRERGHRREYKRKYLRRWRRNNPELNESYWRQRNQERRLDINARSYARFLRHHDAILIQGRLRRRLGMQVAIAEASDLAKKYGRCYPTRFGLTPAGLKECERIRSAMRRTGRKLNPVEIRMMVYEDGLHVTPSRQKMPYQRAGRQLRQWHAASRRAT